MSEHPREKTIEEAAKDLLGLLSFYGQGDQLTLIKHMITAMHGAYEQGFLDAQDTVGEWNKP